MWCALIDRRRLFSELRRTGTGTRTNTDSGRPENERRRRRRWRRLLRRLGRVRARVRGGYAFTELCACARPGRDTLGSARNRTGKRLTITIIILLYRRDGKWFYYPPSRLVRMGRDRGSEAAAVRVFFFFENSRYLLVRRENVLI